MAKWKGYWVGSCTCDVGFIGLVVGLTVIAIFFSQISIKGFIKR